MLALSSSKTNFAKCPLFGWFHSCFTVLFVFIRAIECESTLNQGCFPKILSSEIWVFLPISTRMSNQSGPQLCPAVCIVEAIKQFFWQNYWCKANVPFSLYFFFVSQGVSLFPLGKEAGGNWKSSTSKVSHHLNSEHTFCHNMPPLIENSRFNS